MTDLSQVWLSWLGPLALLLPKLLIIWLSNYSFMSVPDDVYYVPDDVYYGNKSCASNLISTVFFSRKSSNYYFPRTCQQFDLSSTHAVSVPLK
jgi:hypothetical protein